MIDIGQWMTPPTVGSLQTRGGCGAGPARPEQAASGNQVLVSNSDNRNNEAEFQGATHVGDRTDKNSKIGFNSLRG